MNVLIAEDDAMTRLMRQRAVGQGHALLVATRARARIAVPSGTHAGVPCEVLLWG